MKFLGWRPIELTHSCFKEQEFSLSMRLIDDGSVNGTFLLFDIWDALRLITTDDCMCFCLCVRWQSNFRAQSHFKC